MAEIPERSISDDQLRLMREKTWNVFADFIDKDVDAPLIEFCGYYFTPKFLHFMERMIPMDIDKEDVFVCSFPKSGTTWMQHIVWYICTLDFDTEEEIDFRFPQLDMPAPYPPKPENLDEILKNPPPRFFKSHCAASFLPKKVWDAKLIYCYRNPKDCCVSYFHHQRAMAPVCYSGTFDQFAELFVQGKAIYGPWHRNVRSYYDAMKEGKPVLMVAFEDMKKDRMGTIKRVAEFLGKQLTEEQFQKVYDATSFEVMKKNETGNYEYLKQIGFWDNKMQPFMRKGKVGDWKNYLAPEMQEKFDNLIKEHFGDTDLKFSDKQ